MRTPSLLRKLALTTALVAAPAASFGSVFISVGFAPPALPVYAQPICPGDGYIWTPGYWAWSDEDEGYYWVPGVWVQPPTVGVLWTPGYWGWESNAYLWHTGYWGPHIGFYGGVNYGFGYGGFGYEGGYWNHGAFAYNRAVNNINVTNIHNVYNRTVIVNNNTTINRVSYNGGNGGLQARPTAQEQTAVREQHFQPTANQATHQSSAAQNRAQFASFNHGQPPMAAQARIGDRSTIVPARNISPQGSTTNAGQQRGFAQTNGTEANGAVQRGSAQPSAAQQNGAPQRGFAGQPNAAPQQGRTTMAQQQQRGVAVQPNAQPQLQQRQPQYQAQPQNQQTRPQQYQAQPQNRQTQPQQYQAQPQNQQARPQQYQPQQGRPQYSQSQDQPRQAAPQPRSTSQPEHEAQPRGETRERQHR